MFEFRNNRIGAVMISLILLLSACGPSASEQEATISTAVAQTVQAQSTNEMMAVATSPMPTDTPSPISTALPATATGTSVPQSSGGLCDASASLVGETIPDGTIIQPGTTFTKVWQIKNTGTCIWDANWQLVFYGGDQMGGLNIYNFPQPAQPDQILDIPIILKSPDGNGTYTGEWILKSPWGETFGVGQYSVPISVSILVGSGTPENKKTETVYGVTSVTYQVDRRCDPANTVYTITAFITTNGPVEVIFTWVQSDGNDQRNNRINFTEATTKSAQREWIQHSTNSSTNQRWIKVVITSPTHQSFQELLLPKLCGQQ